MGDHQESPCRHSVTKSFEYDGHDVTWCCKCGAIENTAEDVVIWEHPTHVSWTGRPGTRQDDLEARILVLERLALLTVKDPRPGSIWGAPSSSGELTETGKKIARALDEIAEALHTSQNPEEGNTGGK